MINLADYWKGRDKQYPKDLTPEVIANATETLRRANALLTLFGSDRGCNSGWRPKTVQMEVNPRAPNSKHITGCAIDIEDANCKLKEFLVFNQDVLEKLDLYMEHPSTTKTWVHVQTVPPISKRRIFFP